MTQPRRVVVPFDRSAAYCATRARRHYTPDRLPDAARLLRKALEKGGDAATALELSSVYAGMGCYTAAERYLAQAVSRSGLTGGVCFALGECALGRGEYALAEHAFEGSLRLDPGGLYARQAQRMLETYPWPIETPLPRSARGDVLAQRAQQALMEGHLKEARKGAQQAWQKCHSWQNAVLLASLSTPKESLSYLRFAIKRQRVQPMPRLLLSRACYLTGRKKAAMLHLKAARSLCLSLSQVESFCALAWEMEATAEALSLTRAHLARHPMSADLLRLKYISLQRLGQKEKAQRTLSTLLEIDPHDGAALWYRSHPEEENPQMARSMLLTVLGQQLSAIPQRLSPGPLNRLLHLLVMALAEEMDAEPIYEWTPRLWRRLSPAQRRACDERRGPHYSLAFSLFLLLATGHGKRAGELFSAAPGKKRLLRTLRHFTRWMNKE